MADPRDRAIDAMLAEYASLRGETTAAVGHRFTVVGLTFAMLGVVISALLQRKIADAVAGLIGLFFVPTVTKAALLVWLGEHERAQRAGHYLVQLERKINGAVDEVALEWETTLARGSRELPRSGSEPAHMQYPYVAVAGLLLAVGYTGIGVGAYLLHLGARPIWWQIAVGGTVALEVAFAVPYWLRWRRVFAPTRSGPEPAAG